MRPARAVLSDLAWFVISSSSAIDNPRWTDRLRESTSILPT